MVELNPVAVETEILRLSTLLDDATNRVLKRSRDAAIADAEFKVANAHAILKARDADRKVTVDTVQAIAAIETQDEYRKKVVAEAVLDSAKEAGRNIRSQLDALRSVNTNLRQLVTA